LPCHAKLHNGDTIHAHEDAHELVERFEAAQRDGKLAQVHAGQGTVWINPSELATISQAS
jgi:hypothetical protein